MRKLFPGPVLAVILSFPLAVSAGPARGYARPGPNIALGKSYTCEPDPADHPYRLTVHEEDCVHLTDGVFAPENGSIWMHRETVGWHGIRTPLKITIDLGEEKPIAGAGVNMQAGSAGVHWPSSILVLASSDGSAYRVAGDLVHLSSREKERPEAARHMFASSELYCRGRYLRFVIPPGRYIFIDEIEVYEGAAELLDREFEGEVVPDIESYLAENHVPLAIRNRVERDLQRARKEVESSGAPASAREKAMSRLYLAGFENTSLEAVPDADYRSIFPLSGLHADIFAVLGELRGGSGLPRIGLWKTNRWERLCLWDTPAEDKGTGASLNVRMMAGEHRGDTLNIANNSGVSIDARVWMEGLPGGRAPGYIRILSAEYVALTSGIWDADALVEVPSREGAWHVKLPAGVSRQLWVSFNPCSETEPGDYHGRLAIEPYGGEAVYAPVNFRLEPLSYPEEHTLSFGMWCYTDSSGAYGLNPGNIPAAVRHMRSYGYNVPWSRGFPWVTGENFDAAENLVIPPDMSRFDSWVSMWPGARYYAVFAGGWTERASEFAGAAIGSERFNRRVGNLMRYWAGHVRGLGIDPGRILILTVDEPRAQRGAERSILWARAIKAAVPEFMLFTDPTDRRPHETGLREMYEAHDILCPHISHYTQDGSGARVFYEELRAGGRELWFYNTSGGPASLDATKNHRGQQWKLWTAGGTGTHFWSYADTGGRKAGSWNQLAPGGEIYSKVYIDSKSVTDGKHWMAIIEGIQDYEYMAMLELRISELEAGSLGGTEIDRARAVLETVPERAVRAADAGDIEAYDRGRLAVLDALVAVDRKAGGRQR